MLKRGGMLAVILKSCLRRVGRSLYVLVDNDIVEPGGLVWFMKIRKISRWMPALAMAGVALAVFSARARAAEVMVFAAASLTDCLKKIGAAYEKKSGQKAEFNFGASSTLARQIEEGAPADIFFSADEARMDELEHRGLVVSGTRESHLSNSLVVIVAADSGLKIHSAEDLAGSGVKQIALADPKIVPAGVYSREYFEKLHLWQAVQPKVVPTDNVRAALAAVESGNVDAGMVYKTDAAISHRVKVACEIPAHDGPPISYPMAVLTESAHPDAARAFLEFLDGREASAIFERYGFVVRQTAVHER